jgi:hypothetical protein
VDPGGVRTVIEAVAALCAFKPAIAASSTLVVEALADLPYVFVCDGQMGDAAFHSVRRGAMAAPQDTAPDAHRVLLPDLGNRQRAAAAWAREEVYDCASHESRVELV